MGLSGVWMGGVGGVAGVFLLRLCVALPLISWHGILWMKYLVALWSLGIRTGSCNTAA